MKSKSFYNIRPEELYDIIRGKDSVGIEGYQCTKKYFDYRENLWIQKRNKIMDSHRAIWPPLDWKLNEDTNKRKPPKKFTYIDEQIKWANSFNDSKKSEQIKEALEAKGKTIPQFINPYKSDFVIKKGKIDARKAFFDRQAKLEKIKLQISAIPEYKQHAIEEAKEKMNKNQYSKGPKKQSWDKGNRIMYYEDSEYLGEKNPFWNNNPKEEDSKKAEFKPNKIRLMLSSPVWSIGPKKAEDYQNKSINQYIVSRDEKIEDKANSVLNKLGVTRKNYFLEPIISYYKVHNHGKVLPLMRTPYNYADKEQYKASLENRKYESPSPHSYWDDGKSKIRLRKNIDDDQAKKYIMTRDKTYSKIYLSGLRKSIY